MKKTPIKTVIEKEKELDKELIKLISAIGGEINDYTNHQPFDSLMIEEKIVLLADAVVGLATKIYISTRLKGEETK